MHSLADTQDQLQNAIFKKESCLDFIKDNGNISVDERVQVHLDTVHENLVNSLHIIYKGVWKLIGEDCARGVALSYSHNIDHIQARGRINDFGNVFPEFLNKFSSLKHLEYLKDFAKLEWIKAKSYEAPKQESLSLDDLQVLFESGIESCSLKFNSSIFFLKSEFPLRNIQEMLDNPGDKGINLHKSDCFVVVCRVNSSVETIYLDEAKWKFLEAISRGKNIGLAVENFKADDMESEVSTMIQLMISKNMLVR